MSPISRRRLLSGIGLLGVGGLIGASPVIPRGRLTWTREGFRLDGQRLQIRSGEMHYPRVPRELWRDRFRQMLALGLNTLSTYAFWSQHEPAPGHWDFSGGNDLRAYLEAAADEGLHLILRPGPYVCAEVDFGGLPAWLLSTAGLRVRSFDPRFLVAAGRYLRRLADEVGHLQSSRGGPLLMLQFENEYGSFGQDREYLDALLALYREAGFDAPLYTADGGEEGLFEGGTLPSLPAVVNFGGDVAEAKDSFGALAEWRAADPPMCGEYWAGWFDHWGEAHHRQPDGEASAVVEWMMERGHSFNLYMVHGGTSFGWLPGANASSVEPYQPDTTSYDYDAPIDEAGRLTPKYREIRAAILRHLPAGEVLPPVPDDPRTQAVPPFTLAPVADLERLLKLFSTPRSSHRPHPMEYYGQCYGHILYRTRTTSAFEGPVTFGDIRDEALVFLDGREVGALSRRRGERSLTCAWQAGQTLDILVENTGRIGFGAKFPDERKGLIGEVRAHDRPLMDWTVYPLQMHAHEALGSAPVLPPPQGPALYRGSFELGEPRATFLVTRGWGRGQVWINGKPLGRYWSIGPQQSLYVPAPWLKSGRNEVLLYTGGANGSRQLRGSAEPEWGAA